MDIDWVIRAQSAAPRVRSFIDGRDCDGGGESVSKYGPRDGRLLCRFGAGESRDVDAAVGAARRAFDDGRWSALPAQHRKEVLLNLAHLLDTHREELALLECLDVGKPISDALHFDVPTAAANLRYNAEGIDKILGNVYAADRSSLSYQLSRPVGVVAGVVGWNFPLLLAVGKIAPALATGNTLVLKPSEWTSFSATRVAELALEAGVPAGVLNVLAGGPAMGAALALHRDIDLLTFTGSTHTGKKLLIAAGQSNMKRLILECGGKAANIVFDDMDNLDAVAEAIVARAFWNQGEVCTASSRLLVQDSIKEALLLIIIQKTAALDLGDPLNPKTKLGALVSEAHQRKVLDYIDSGEREGASKVYQSPSRPPHAEGFYVPPVIFDEVSPQHKIAREEIFGPVLSVIGFRDEEDALRIANDTIYGLSTILWTKDLGRAHRMTYGMKSGWVVVNATGTPVGGPGEGVLPVGGHKESGIGIEGGIEGLQAYLTQTSVQLFV